jgi:hypothetical protein
MADVIECPLCGDLVDTGRMDDSLKGSHVPGHGPAAWRLCEASGLYIDEALAIAILRAEGGERLRLAAHP